MMFAGQLRGLPDPPIGRILDLIFHRVGDFADWPTHPLERGITVIGIFRFGLAVDAAPKPESAEIICSIQMPASTLGFCAMSFFLTSSSERISARRISARKSPQ
jgi:hypothetical protein